MQKLAIGEQLSRLRQEAGLTQAQVAQRAKTTASAISRYENAEYDRYELRTLQRIVGACGGRLDIILSLGQTLTGPLRLGRRAPRNVGLQRRVAQIVDAIIYIFFHVPAFTVVCRKSAMN